jgi:chemosensory pili system protein ChpA (sensor histidine kinase/response regulator)
MISTTSAQEIFSEEALEHLDVLEAGLLALEDDPGEQANQSMIDQLFRSAHSLKGAAALLKYQAISEIAHEVENLLEAIKLGTLHPGERLHDALLAAIDGMRTLLQMIGRPDYADFSALQALRLCQQLQTACSSQEPEEEKESTAGILAAQVPGQRQTSSVKVEIDQIDQLMRVLGEMTMTKNHLLEQVQQAEQMKEEIDFAQERLLREVRRFSERHEYARPQEAAPADGASLVADFEELEFDRYDELNLFSRKLHEMSNDIQEALVSIRSAFGQISVDVEVLDRMTAELKDRLSVIRTLPVERLYQRFRRTFRDLVRASGVQAELRFEGGETRLGRTVIDGLFDPLVHLLRNALAHGIESVEERRAQGKPDSGTIRILTQRRGNSALIRIEDDGRGIPLEQVRHKAVSLGWLAAEERPDDQALIDLIFRPGFSTRSVVDDIAGRGVGLDAVLSRLSDLNGTVDVETDTGRGTCFILQIPLSLIIINVIQFRLGTQLFVLPTALIEEIQSCIDIPVGARFMRRQEESYRLVDLNHLLAQPCQDDSRRCVLYVRTLGARLGLLVEEVISQEDTVIRPFGRLLADMPVFSGTSVSGGGQIRLVLNPARLAQVVDQEAGGDPAATMGAVTPVRAAVARVLVVDDSLSVRKYASLILEHQGVEVFTATNGQEALDLLLDKEVDLVLTDLEMPVMHGYELLAEMRRREALRRVPVVVISSRSGEAHQNKARQLGAADYLVKPFDEQRLVEMVREHTLCTL